MFVKRDYLATYTQTILGPFWFILQPVLTTIMFTVVFGNIAGISTDGQPKILFYMSGLVIWSYFSDCLNKTSNVFVSNAGIFGKVYFPRLITPLSIVISGLMRFGIQLVLLLAIWAYYQIVDSAAIQPHFDMMLLIPVLILMMAGYAIGLGMIISSMTTKYRDFGMLVGFGVGLLMYATPVIYPMNSVPDKYQFIISLNPLSSIVESFRYILLGTGSFVLSGLSYSFLVMLFFLFLGIMIFNRVEKSFMDSV